MMILRTSGPLAATGLALGLGLSVAAQGALRELLFEIAPTDPGVIAGAASLLCGTTLLASYLPARRAARIDPVTALRAE